LETKQKISMYGQYIGVTEANWCVQFFLAKSGQRFKNIVAHWFLSCATSPRAAIK
jgi:hypothetical protein